MKKLGIIVLLLLASIGWIVLFVQNPIVLAKARWKYQQGIWGTMEIDGHKVEMSPKGEVIVVYPSAFNLQGIIPNGVLILKFVLGYNC